MHILHCLLYVNSVYCSVAYIGAGTRVLRPAGTAYFNHHLRYIKMFQTERHTESQDNGNHKRTHNHWYR